MGFEMETKISRNNIDTPKSYVFSDSIIILMTTFYS